MTERKSVYIRLQGTTDQLQETRRRSSHVIHLSNLNEYPSRMDPNIKLAYYRGYFYEKDTLLDQLEAAMADLRELELQKRQLEQENAELKRQLGLVPQPRPYDAVLGIKHRQSTNF